MVDTAQCPESQISCRVLGWGVSHLCPGNRRRGCKCSACSKTILTRRSRRRAVGVVLSCELFLQAGHGFNHFSCTDTRHDCWFPLLPNFPGGSYALLNFFSWTAILANVIHLFEIGAVVLLSGTCSGEPVYESWVRKKQICFPAFFDSMEWNWLDGLETVSK